MRQIEQSARRFQVLSDPIRLQISLLLRDGEMCVGDLADVLNINQSKVSYHLKRMYEEGLLERRTEYTWGYYSLATDLRAWVNQVLDQLLEDNTLAEARGL